MPWKEVCQMDERIRFVVEATYGKETMAQLCRKYEISRKTGYKWLNRSREKGVAGLAELSRAPKNCPHKTPIEMRDALIALRKANPAWGPKKIAFELQNSFGLKPPATSTIAEIFKKEGLSKQKRRRNARVKRQHDKLTDPIEPNHVWTVDYKGWFRLLGGEKCWPLTVMDLFSRYVVGCEPLDRPALDITLASFEYLFRRFGLPQVIRVDNGTPFAGSGAGGLSQLSVLWLRLGIDVEFIEPGKPQQNGSHERMHRSLKRELRRGNNIRSQLRRCRAWRRTYNHKRGHESLDFKTPAELYSKSERKYPAKIGDFTYPSEFTVRRVKPSGVIKWQGKQRYLNQGLKGCSVGLVEAKDGSMAVYAGTVFLGVLREGCSRGLEEPLELI